MFVARKLYCFYKHIFIPASTSHLAKQANSYSAAHLNRVTVEYVYGCCLCTWEKYGWVVMASAGIMLCFWLLQAGD